MPRGCGGDAVATRTRKPSGTARCVWGVLWHLSGPYSLNAIGTSPMHDVQGVAVGHHDDDGAQEGGGVSLTAKCWEDRKRALVRGGA